LTLALLAASGAVRAAGSAAQIEDACRADLAHRLHLDLAEISVVKTEPVTWDSGAWGLQRPGMVYTKALVPGLRVELKARAYRYYYHTGGDGLQYAGRADLWDASALYLEPIADEPNLNGNLVQLSLLGTNPQIVLSGVSDFALQTNGAILATRRTSRSGFDLVYLMPNSEPGPAAAEGRVLTGAFALACPVLSPAGDRYAVFFRPMVGMPWAVERGALGGKPEALPDLPVTGQPQALAWDQAGLLATVRTDQELKRFRLVEKDGAESWEAAGSMPAGDPGFATMLSKSTSLIIENAPAGDPGGTDHPSTRIYEKFFLGDERNIAVLDNFVMTQVEVTPSLRFALIVGRRDEVQKAYTVDLHTGEILETLPDTAGPIHLFVRPSHWEPPLRGW
jgi:hypothetical protein